MRGPSQFLSDLCLALQQAQNTLLRGIRLCQHRGGRLAHDLVLGQVCSFLRKVNIFDARLGCFGVYNHIAQVVDRVIQAVGHCAQFRTCRVHILQRAVDGFDCVLSRRSGQRVDRCDAVIGPAQRVRC